MNEVSYNWLMGTIRSISAQAALVFSDSVGDSSDSTSAQRGKSPEEVLKNIFGYDSFRPLQRDVIQNVLDGRDTLAVMPTGGGKSLCYQVPALIFDGITVVVSPLIALMQDQVSQLESAGVEAVFLNSSMSAEEYEEAVQRILTGRIKLLYVSPEGLNSGRINSILHGRNVLVSCITVDEAHCISSWGHDFRPDYMEIASIREQFPRAVCLALTATATKQVQQDIISNLKMENPALLVASFNRPNLYLEVRKKDHPQSQVVNFLRQHSGESGIIYCFSRRQVDELTEFLKKAGFNAEKYHAGLSDGERADHQNDFIKDKVDIMVATLAFGMGINKPNVRFVIHYDMPKSIEQYYQEIGRAGRDGLASSALLLYSYGDLHKIRYFFEDSADPEQAERLLQGMVRYAETKTCRRQQLLSYFGEAYFPEADSNEERENFSCCDLCSRGPVANRDVTIPVQKYMSCILRTRQRFGASYIIDVLLGSKNKRVLDNGDNNLSTWGIGRELTRNDWLELNSCLLDAGYLTKSSDYGILSLTNLGHTALMERRQVSLPVEFTDRSVKIAFPKPGSNQAASAGKIENDDKALRIAEKLRKWRRETAEDMNVPPYVIFGDKSLFDIAAKKPASLPSLMDCYGIGAAKAQKFWKAILKIVEEA